MARGLALCSNGGKASIFISGSIARVSVSFSRETLFASQLFRGHCLRFARLFCKCVSVTETVDVARFKEVFERRMAMAGLKPHHRIALGVSGGPDSMALSVLTANWKTEGQNGVNKTDGLIDGLVAIVVDHGLRQESKDEAEAVSCRVSEMGIRCEIACCDWVDGRPKQGHLQEAAREMRYQMLLNVCLRENISVLLIAHHADDQAELFVLRLSRNSGVLGLAGMAFASEIFPSEMHLDETNGKNRSVLLVRPLMDFLKEDMYKICKWGKQDWVEDPTNRSQLFARNRIRMSISNLQSVTFRSELQAVISECRRTRSFVDRVCSRLIDQTVTVTDKGYAIIDLQRLNPSEIKDICVSKYIGLVLQFISQKQRPIRGNTSKLLLNYLRTVPCRTSLTAAGCYLCPAPGSKGTKVIVSCSVDCPLPTKTQILQIQPDKAQRGNTSDDDLSQIISEAKSFSDHSVPDMTETRFLDVASESVLSKAREFNLLSDTTCATIGLLQRDESNRFKSKPEEKTMEGSESSDKEADGFVSVSDNAYLQAGKACYLMNRFLIKWNLSSNQREPICKNCPVSADTTMVARYMVESDWLHLGELSRCSDTDSDSDSCSGFRVLSAGRALVSLKLIPAAARRSLLVLVDLNGLILSIPAIGFRYCQCLEASAVFLPRVPLGGGFSSFV
ncbi:PREDICTED: uncharacterized protein LOC104808766 isoform X2 [Tarenaya hassleriana]|uniref:uncharacterized protein LOC104808766 isoform X2 n=1 Tax=Tarenaya hassleriana TaxID=28532 RepID=UPI00053CA46B|nr:PREDICTED: uncharacterized protein LOC104808766 isoform X2 [Tarenaya hassleriana]